MKNELALLYRIVAGDLAPSLTLPDQYPIHTAFLQERYPKSEKQFIVHFLHQDRSYVFSGYETYSFGQTLDIPRLKARLKEDPELLSELLAIFLPQSQLLPSQITSQKLFTTDSEAILYIIANLDINTLPPAEARFHYYYLLCQEEAERIKRHLPGIVFSLSTEEQIRQYIHNHHQLLFTLAGIVRRKLSLNSLNALTSFSHQYSLEDIYKAFYRTIKGLYQFLEIHFSGFLQADLPLPDQNWSVDQAEVQQKVKELRERLSLSNLPSQLVQMVLIPLDPLYLGSITDCITFRKIRYAKTYLQTLITSIDLGNSRLEEKQLVEQLQELNFNHPAFFAYCADMIEREADAGEDLGEQLETLWFWLKVYKQSPTIKHLVYNPLYPPLRTQLIRWIEEEIRFRYRKWKLNQQNRNNTSGGEELPKIQTSLSVAELAFLSRILYDTQVFTNVQQKDILRIISRHFSSVKKDQISLQSLMAKYYNPEESTQQSIKSLAQRIVRYLENARY